MIIIWVRNIVLVLLVMTAIYLILSSGSRKRHHKKLQLEFQSKNEEISQEQFIATGMQKYERSLKPKLFVGVYLFPLAVIILLGYLAQHSS